MVFRALSHNWTNDIVWEFLLGEFASLEFSPDETKLMYVAEMKQPKSEPFFKRKAPKSGENKDEETPVTKVGITKFY